jgi:TPR repeat protein
MHNLVVLYQNGDGLNKNQKKALKLFEGVSKNSHSGSMYEW